jgi:AraC-like DNA-binding protein
MDTQSNEGGSEASQPPDAWWQRVGGLTGVPALMRALDVDAPAVLAGAGLAPDGLDQADNRIPFDAFGRVLQSAADKADYAHFGLTAGRMWHLEDLGALSEVVRHSSSVGEALQSLALYQHFNGEGGLTFTARHGPLVEVGYAIYYPGVVGPDQIYDFALASLFNYLRELCGQSWLPVQVLIPHAPPADPVHYRSFFKVVPQFDTEICALRFPAHWLDRPIDGADPVRRRKALAIVEAMAKPFQLQQVYRALRSVLLTGRSSGNDVACALSMHRRTLNRRLQECGTTFQALLDEVRCEVARQLLCYSNVALDDVAASLGYAGVSPFMRSFRRWTGVTPGRMRRLALHGAGSCSEDDAAGEGDDAPAPRASGRAGSGAAAPRASVRTLQSFAPGAGARNARRPMHA